MANEARVFAEGTENVIVRQVTVADGTAIAKGSLLVFVGGSRTAIIHRTVDGNVGRPAGFATMSKEANDGITEIGGQRTGVVDAIHDGVVTSGDLAKLGSTTINRLERVAPVGAMSYQIVATIVGRWLENGTDGQQSRCSLCLG